MTRGGWLVTAAVLATAAASGYAPRVFLWRDPGVVEALDFSGALDGEVRPPAPPFRFEREDTSGTQPKLFVQDAAGVTWNVKFGFEVKAEAFAWRIVRACGYFAEPSFFVASGRIEGLPPALRRRPEALAADGQFTGARLQIRTPRMQFVPGRAWHWTDNPFRDSVELKDCVCCSCCYRTSITKTRAWVPQEGPTPGSFAC